jgi:adenosylmethionine-8-amino-7-oxononanoate aminotransferase
MFMDVPHIPPPYCYRCHFNLTHPKCGIRCGLALEDEILRFGEDNISAFVAEPISGATLGAVVPPAEYWPIIREICDKYGILLIIDEVMTGMGRCGRWFAHEHWGIQADIITIGKGTTGGYFPLSIMAVKGEHAKLIANTMGDFIHGGTYSHHAVGCAAGLATLEYLKTYNLIDVVKKRGEQLQNLLEDNFGNLDYVGDIRGLGLMWGLEFVKDKSDKTPFNPNLHLGQKIADKAMEIGLIIYPGSGCVDGFRGDHIMIGPPYIITDEQLGRLVELIKQSISLVLEAYI